MTLTMSTAEMYVVMRMMSFGLLDFGFMVQREAVATEVRRRERGGGGERKSKKRRMKDDFDKVRRK